MSVLLSALLCGAALLPLSEQQLEGDTTAPLNKFLPAKERTTQLNFCCSLYSTHTQLGQGVNVTVDVSPSLALLLLLVRRGRTSVEKQLPYSRYRVTGTG